MMKGVCKFFETGKKCPYGDRCRFKHKLSSSNSATPGQKGHNRQTSASSSSAEGGHPNGSPSNDNDHANLLKKWLYYVPKEKRKSRPLGDDELAKFVELALKLLESSADNMQLVISVLGEECGLVRVREIIDRNFENMDDDKLEAFIAALLLPYFRILSHDTVLQSMVVETQHTALLNTLYGINGERGSNIFTALARGLSAREDHECIEIVIPVLAGVLERNSSAMANTNLQAAAEVLVSLLDVSNLSRAAERHLRTIKTVLHLAINLSETCAIPGHVGSDSAATFTVDQDLPGALSERGPRHDNDSDDIQDIEILPTLQEILSERTEYLPREDPNLWHIRGLPGLIDRNFRLVREDTVGQLRDAVKAQLYHQRSAGDTPRISEQEVRTNAYHGVSLYNVMFDAKKGLLFVLRFQQPQLLHGKSSKKREDWWQESQRLAPESLICLLSSSEEANQEATFLVVHSPDLGSVPPKLKTTGSSIHKQHTLWKDREHAFVTAQLASTEPFAASDFIKGCLSSRQVRRSLIEFPGVLLPTFGPTLSALQRMAASLDVPFAEALIPDANRAEPRRPAYSVRGGFRYNLRGLLPENLRDQYRNTDNTPQGIASALELSGLDKTQREAAQHALTHAIGLIQGPPGTGKSYTGVKILQVLLDNKHAANLGPIICVCYTNHALDQLLENLLDAGISQIVRIGSRSRSERLAGINLRTLAWQHSFTKMEGKHWFDSKCSIEETGQAINQLVQHLRSILRNPEKEIISLLNAKYPYFCAQLPQDVDEDGFIVVHGKKTSSCWRTWWKEGPALPFARDRSLAVLRSGTVRLFDMTRGEREALHNSWIDELTSCIYQDLRIELATFNRNKAAMESLRGDVDLRVLSNANVVGVTTTGLARQLGTLSKLRSKVLVVEEAGEVLEAHLLTAMLPSLEHAILIGDHQQLRPKVQNYDLSAENPRSNQIALDVSLFERLIHPRQENVHGLPYVTLETQRRMHPYVSRLIRSTLYPNLQDAESVKTYPEVVGMRKRLFWMDHKKKEDGKRTQMQSASRTNRYEVEMVAALVGHLQKQGVYTANDIAVLTPYLGQLRHLKEKLQNSFGIILNDRDIDELAQEDATKDVELALAADSSRRRKSMTKGTLLQAIRLATVDNFQGEEAKVVIISLVRSNDSNSCGFLRTPNRINVLLSRAKHGMYILGNSATASSVPMWQRILEIFRTEGNIGTVLELSCPRHPDTAMQVTEPEDFSRVAPEAGCDLMCGKQLPCGHACPSKCHAESLHNGVHCLKDCVRPRKGCTHPCKRACGDECEAQCAIIVQCDITLPCGHHVTRMPCWSYQDTARYICREPVERQVPGCGHDVVVACRIAVDDPGYCCQERCSSTLECGHNCQSACFECRPRNHEGKSDTINHAKCTHRCGRSFTSCVHSCPEQCHTGEPCPPCSSNCEVRCIHSACQKQCHEPCTPCMEEKCPSFCEHAECQMPCGAPCDWVPCSKRCKKVLGCGHQCPSMCGEMCPSSKFCQVCATEEVRDSTVDLYTLEKYAELDLDKTPCLFPPCGHIFTVETLDGQMDISKHYDMGEVDHLSVPVSIKDGLLPLSYENLKTCPNCRGCLRTIARYGRVIRRALLDENTKKFIAWSHQAYLPLAEKFQQKQGELLKTVGQTPLIAEVSFTGPSTLAAAIRRSTAGRYTAFLKLRRAIANFTNKVRAEEQPFQRVRDLVESVRRRQNVDMPKFEYDRSILQTRGTLLAIALGLRCDLVIITDLVRNWESMPHQQRSAKPLSIILSKYRMECDSFYESAMKSKYPLQQAEGHIFWAHFAALECGATLALGGNSLQKSEALKREAVLHLNQAKEICRMFPGQTNSVTSEVNGVRAMLEKSISSAEMRMVVAVMSREFSVTGHWYCCTNGHPFTIGECGGPMEQTRCPECSAPIGGQRHIAAAGVTRAENIEREFGNLHMEE